jgi:FkbM family methyltransferase
MKIIRNIQKLILFFYLLVKFWSIRLAYTLSYFNINLKNVSLITREGKFIKFKSNNNLVSIKLLSAFNFSINELFILLENPISKIYDSNDDMFYITINELEFKVSSLSNMVILYEIFIQRIYEVSLFHNNYVIIDIGMNVGVASLYFANMHWVEKVYGYEPFPDTFNEAINNINLNDKISHKIKPLNIGVSSVTCEKSITLFDSGLLSATTLENNNNIDSKMALNQISVNLISANELINNVTNEHPDSKILLKIDCEGEEYGIFDSLDTTNNLDKVDCILLEWHEKGIESLSAILKSKGFQYYHFPNESLNSGMLYAFRYN